LGGTWLEECIHELHAELGAAHIRFRPECYLADEWLVPDKEPVIGHSVLSCASRGDET